MERNSEDFNFLQSDLDKLCEINPSYKCKTLNDLKIQKISYGMGSYVFKISFQNDHNTVLFRKYIKSKSKEKIEKENIVFQTMSDNNVAPKLYGCTNELRVEEFIPSRIIESHQINDVDLRRKLAIKLAKFHNMKLDIFNGDKKDYLSTVLTNEYYMQLYNKNISKQDIYSQYEWDYITKIKELFSEEVKDFVLKSYSGKYELVLSHNDLWVGNLLLSESREIHLIDFEVVCWNFAGYDCGKLLLEPMFKRRPSGPEYDLTESLMPNEQEIVDFTRYYLVSRRDDNFKWNSDLDKFEAKIYSCEDEKKYTVEEFLREIYLGMMISGYYCAVLGMILGKNEAMPMDFIKFAIDGYDIYIKYKTKLFNI
jgi:choline/ethanolamine kinase